MGKLHDVRRARAFPQRREDRSTWKPYRGRGAAGPGHLRALHHPTWPGMQTSYAWDRRHPRSSTAASHYTTCGMEAPAIIVIAKGSDGWQRPSRCDDVPWSIATPGVTINKASQDGPRNAPPASARCFLERHCRVPRSAILGMRHNGFMQTMANFTRERIANVSGVIANGGQCVRGCPAPTPTSASSSASRSGRFELVQER